jgi:O-antigen ligase
MIAAFPLCGSGYGTFVAAYPSFRSAGVRALYTHAHNDLLQAWIEGGVLGGVCLTLLFVPVLRSTLRALGGAKGTLGVGFAAGLTAVLLHSLVDFDFHIPANAATAAVLAGMMEGLPWARRP